MEEPNKNIDQTWKEAVEKEKETLKKEGKFVAPEADFTFFVTTLALQATIALGQIANPATNKKEEDRTQAKFIIDTLGMLKDKTSGNLSAEEDKVLDNVLYELRMQYVSQPAKDSKE